MLPCIAVVAIATFVGTKTLESNVNESNNLLLANVKALTNPEGEPYPEERIKCINDGGNWNMASQCVDSGFESAICTVKVK